MIVERFVLDKLRKLEDWIETGDLALKVNMSRGRVARYCRTLHQAGAVQRRDRKRSGGAYEKASGYEWKVKA